MSHTHHNEPNHSHHSHAANCAETNRSHLFASVVSLGMAGVEAAFGLRHGNTALVADALHNIGDALAYIINAVVSYRRRQGHASPALRVRQAAATLICAGAVAAGAKAAYELAATHETDWLDVGVAVAAGAGNYAIRRRFDLHHSAHAAQHGHDPETHDSHRHARTDTAVSVALVGGLGLAATGVEHAEPLTGMAVAGYTIYQLNPFTGVHRG